MPQKKDPSDDDLQSSVDELFADPATQEDQTPGDTESQKDVKPEEHKSGNTESQKDVNNENGSGSASDSGSPTTSAVDSGSGKSSGSAGAAEGSSGTDEKPQRSVEDSHHDEDSFLHVADSPEKKRIHGTDVPKPIAFELEMMKSRLRHITDQKVTMTDIVEAAIRMYAQEFQENGEEGLATQLIYRIRARSG